MSIERLFFPPFRSGRPVEQLEKPVGSDEARDKGRAGAAEPGARRRRTHVGREKLGAEENQRGEKRVHEEGQKAGAGQHQEHVSHVQDPSLRQPAQQGLQKDVSLLLPDQRSRRRLAEYGPREIRETMSERCFVFFYSPSYQ